MKQKRHWFRKYYFAYGSLTYNPENDLLYLEEFQAPDTYDLELTITKKGYLEPHEMYKAHYNSNKDMKHCVDYWEKKQRDMEFV